MQCVPSGTVTGCAVAAGGEILAHRGALQCAVGAVTVRAVLQVRIRSGTDQSIVMAARTAGSRRLDQVAVVRGVGGMSRPPTGGMTGLAVAAEGKVLPHRSALQTAVGCTMTI